MAPKWYRLFYSIVTWFGSSGALCYMEALPKRLRQNTFMGYARTSPRLTQHSRMIPLL